MISGFESASGISGTSRLVDSRGGRSITWAWGSIPTRSNGWAPACLARVDPASPGLEAPSLYGVNYLRDRPTEGLAVGYAAVHAYLLENLRVELLGKLGTDNYRK